MKPIETNAKIAFDIILDGHYYRRVNGVLIEINENQNITHFVKEEDVFESVYALHKLIIECELQDEFDLWLAKQIREEN